MKEAVQAEKNIFNNRMNELKQKTLDTILQMISRGNEFFQKIENMIAYSFKREIDALEEMGLLIR